MSGTSKAVSKRKAVRCDEEDMLRAEALAERMTSVPAFKHLRMKPVDVVRMAMSIGLEQLEAQLDGGV